MYIDWESNNSEVLINPRMPAGERHGLSVRLQGTPGTSGHLWLATSGSTGFVKWVALSKQAVLTSAQAVNTFLASTSEDVWLNALPWFHVGGLGIWARGHLSHAHVVDYFTHARGVWNAQNFYKFLLEYRVTLSALVPAQIYDIVQLQLNAPATLRALIVGGGALSDSLYEKAISLGWKLMPSYGLTECASQVATARDGGLEVLPHVELRISADGLILLKSPSLLTLYAQQTPHGLQYRDPKVDGWFTTEDRGTWEGHRLVVQGRCAHFLKIGGESVDLLRLERILDDLKGNIDLALVAVPDERLGHVIHLATTQNLQNIQQIIDRFNSQVMPFEKIRKVHAVKEIPRSPLMKVLKHELLEALNAVPHP